MAGLRRMPRNASLGVRKVPSLVGRRRQVAWHKKVSSSNPLADYASAVIDRDSRSAAQNDDRQVAGKPAKI